MLENKIQELYEQDEIDYGETTESILRVSMESNNVINQFLGKRDKYGEKKYGPLTQQAQTARDAALLVPGCNEEWVYMAYLGMRMAEPAFEGAGVDFLKEKLPGYYTRINYAIELTRGAFMGVKSDIKENIYFILKDAIKGAPYNTKEAVIMRTVYHVEEYMRKLQNTSDYRFYSTRMVFSACERAIETGQLDYTQEMDEIMERLVAEGDAEWREEIPRRGDAKKLLDTTYDYFMDHIEDIPEEFKKMFPGANKNRLVAYYVATRPDDGLAIFCAKDKVRSYKQKYYSNVKFDIKTGILSVKDIEIRKDMKISDWEKYGDRVKIRVRREGRGIVTLSEYAESNGISAWVQISIDEKQNHFMITLSPRCEEDEDILELSKIFIHGIVPEEYLHESENSIGATFDWGYINAQYYMDRDYGLAGGDITIEHVTNW